MQAISQPTQDPGGLFVEAPFDCVEPFVEDLRNAIANAVTAVTGVCVPAIVPISWIYRV